ncbi:MAG: branched-chain amino acid aminotransferase [Pleomorphochaeta sp.]
MENKEIDWSNLGFNYTKTDKRYVAHCVNGEWSKGTLIEDETITLNESAGVFQYAQTCFEGLKAYTAKNGKIVVFRPELNAKRMSDTCKRLCIPQIPEDLFIEAVEEVVKANAKYVPPYGSSASLYLRPFIIGSSPVIGVSACSEYQFRLFAMPVGAYFKGGLSPIKIMVSDYDRAAPNGTGNIKAGLNYAMSLYPGKLAKSKGYAENMYLDSKTRTFVEETGGANFIFITKDNKVITPKSDTILPSITRRSLLIVAKDILKMEVEERPIKFEEVENFSECGLCGTAAVISPVGLIHTDEKDIIFNGDETVVGPVTRKLYETLIGIQLGEIEAPKGWIKEIL